MLPATPIHAESARYTTSLVFLPGLWAGPEVWRAVSGYLAHRGWEGELVDVRGVGGGIAERGAAVAEHVARLPNPPVLIGHDAGGLVALAAAGRCPAAAAVLLAPLVPGSAGARTLTGGWSLVARLLLGRPIPPPELALAHASLRDLDGASRTAVLRGFGPDAAAAVLDVVRGRVRPSPTPGVPALAVTGTTDPLLPPADAAALAGAIGAEHHPLDGAGHWLLAGPSWQRTVGVVHRWLVRRLGEGLLDFYADAMADRDEG